MRKQHWTFPSKFLPEAARVVCWGHFGAPVLLFPSGGGDHDEAERFHLIESVGHLIDAGRIKVYSVDGIAARGWLRGTQSPEVCSRIQNAYDSYIREDVAALIREDCRTPDLPIVTAGAALGAFNAIASICRHPDVFRAAIGMSGTYDLSRYLRGPMNLDFHYSSPLHYLPDFADPVALATLRRRFIVLPTGRGNWEDPGASWRLAEVLGRKGIPNRVDVWGSEWDHNWITWRAMLPKYLEEVA